MMVMMTRILGEGSTDDSLPACAFIYLSVYLFYGDGRTINSAHEFWSKLKPLTSKNYSSAPIHFEISGKQQRVCT